MKVVKLGATALLVCAFVLSAQERPRVQAASESAVGCVQREGEGFVLLGDDGNFGLLGGDDIAKHVGKRVRVSGNRGAGDITIDAIEPLGEDCDAGAQPSEARAADEDRRRDSKRGGGITADDQGSSKADRETTAKIRRALVEDDSLSTSVKNVKIITRSGHVTLRGRVQSEAEKAAVQSKVESVLGDADFSNELTVKRNRRANPDSER